MCLTFWSLYTFLSLHTLLAPLAAHKSDFTFENEGCTIIGGEKFKLRYLKNLKLFLIRVKKNIWAYSVAKKGDGFLLFLNEFSWETDLGVTLGDLTVKDVKFGREIFI